MFEKPCHGYITSLYDKARKNPVTGKVQPHWGTDYGNHADNTIIAAAAGIVRIAVNSASGFGKYVIITHSNGWETVYAHLSVISVSVGQTVKLGQKIGVKGTTGNSTGIHLHFEISKGKWSNSYAYHVNPALNIDDPDVRSLQTMLNQLGYKVTVDGLYGDDMVKAVAAYQKASKLTADGVAGSLTMGTIRNAVMPILVAQDKPPTTHTPIIKEEIRMFNPTSKTLRDSVINLLDNATHDKVIDGKWLKQAKAGTLSLDDAFALHVEIESRRKVTAK